jgi:hypothetical protein
MKQESSEAGYLVLCIIACLCFALCSFLMLYSLKDSGETSLQLWYGVFVAIWGAGLLFAIIGSLSHLSIFFALSFAFFFGYFAVFSFHFGTLIQVIAGKSGTTAGNDALVGSYAISAAIVLVVVLGFFGLLFRKKGLIVTTLVLTFLCALYFLADFVLYCKSVYAQGKSGWAYDAAAYLSAGATLVISGAFITLLIASIGQIDSDPAHLQKMIAEATENQKPKDL